MQTLWVSMPILRNIVLGATCQPEARQQICSRGGITPADLDNPEMKLSLEQNCALMDAALQLSGDPNLGLHIGERTTVSILGITGYLMESSKDLLTALQHLQQFTSSFSRIYYFGIEQTGEEVMYIGEPIPLWNALSPETARQSVDIAFAGALHILRLLTGLQLQPLRAQYRYPRFADTREHERILKCRPLFSQPCNALTFAKQDLQRSVIGYNRELNLVFKKLLEQKLQEDQGLPFIHQVRTIILEQSRFAFPTLEEVADRIHLTPRTLQRKLQEENSSFRALSDLAKEELARNLLSSKNLNISEIADRLGYSDPAAFQRAFRQWTGKTPKTYQNEAARPALL
ncbi:AraC family transcriptional regulator [Adhaeribacter pallidiroseus]|uniref:HTH-type transcriptional regulator GadW n=1 Tax=Adhaeribacter pallidiroseus TaxID=2072847 RepID=A0A369QHA2_9BACT|nr:AraC family transcriptional regulator [Adhaeribacter pallidiroseus]RDC62647.1 HTH-type transcriptional regulator GadW [Adhaeribacter pallidiroseus]